MRVLTVIRHTRKRRILINTQECTLVKNLTLAIFVVRSLLEVKLWKNTDVYIQVHTC